MRPMMTTCAVSALLAACGPGVHGGTGLGEPITTIRAQLSGAVPPGVDVESLRASILWTVLPAESRACLEQAEAAEAVATCRQTAGFWHGQRATMGVPMDANSPLTFEIPFYTPPAVEDLGGIPGARFGLGLVVVYEDGNLNDALDMVSADATSSVDAVVAASASLSIPPSVATLVIYREGGVAPEWKLFGADCPEPPVGYSILDAMAESCSFGPASTVVPVAFDESDATRQLICEPEAFASSLYPEEPIPEGAEVTCWSGTTVEYVDPSLYCGRPQYYSLAGCYGAFSCPESEYDWDLRADPPDWWPCFVSKNELGLATTYPVSLTAGSDKLFAVYFISGPDTFAVSQLEFWVYGSSESESPVILSDSWLDLWDKDHDGRYSPDEWLDVIEPDGVSLFDESHLHHDYPVEMRIRSEGAAEPALVAVFTWALP